MPKKNAPKVRKATIAKKPATPRTPSPRSPDSVEPAKPAQNPRVPAPDPRGPKSPAEVWANAKANEARALVRSNNSTTQALATARLITEETVNDAKEFMAASKAENTRRAYASDWKAFTAWCAANKQSSMPTSPAVVVLYLTTLAREGKKVATIKRAKTSIAVAHQTANEKDPSHSMEVKNAMQGITRTLGAAPNKKTAVLADDTKKMLELCTREIEDAVLAADAHRNEQDANATYAAYARARRATRDRALLALWFAGGFRRSEVAAIEREHLSFQKQGLAVYIPRSKTDQEGKGRTVGIVHEKTIEYVRQWVEEEAEIQRGPVFVAVSVHGALGDKAIDGEALAEVVKKYAKKAGLDPKKYAGHSMRRGHITQAKRNGVDNEDIMRQTGHKSVQTFLGYIESANVFENNSSKGLWK